MKKAAVFGLVGIGLFATGCQKAELESSAPDPGRELVMESIAAHGGKDKWYGNGQLQFRWKYHMTDKGPDAVVDTVQTVDPSSMAVVHEVVGKDIRFGMNNGKDWIRPENAEFMPPPRFWALTPFYFIGIPFVFNDPNADFEILPDVMEFEGRAYTQVKVTYTEGAGDSPDDYYVLLVDPETKLTRGAYYIVTSSLVANDGPGPPKFITLDNLQDVGGVKLAGRHRTFAMQDEKIGGEIRFTEVSGVKWLPAGTVNLDRPEQR